MIVIIHFLLILRLVELFLKKKKFRSLRTIKKFFRFLNPVFFIFSSSLTIGFKMEEFSLLGASHFTRARLSQLQFVNPSIK